MAIELQPLLAAVRHTSDCAGVWASARGCVTHAYNPALFSLRNSSSAGLPRTTSEARTLVWSADGGVLWQLNSLGALSIPESERCQLDAGAEASDCSLGGSVFSQDCIDGWYSSSIDGAECPFSCLQRTLVALDVSDSSPLRQLRSAPGVAPRMGAAVPFCLEWQAQTGPDHQSGRAGMCGTLQRLRCRFEHTENARDGSGLPSAAECGAALVRTPARCLEEAALVPGPRAGSLWLCKATGLHELCVA